MKLGFTVEVQRFPIKLIEILPYYWNGLLQSWITGGNFWKLPVFQNVWLFFSKEDNLQNYLTLIWNFLEQYNLFQFISKGFKGLVTDAASDEMELVFDHHINITIAMEMQVGEANYSWFNVHVHMFSVSHSGLQNTENICRSAWLCE